MAGERKVELSQLLFTQNWEDPALDRAAFALQPGARVATVCSGACNTFAFLLDDPAAVFAFDYNPAQVWVMELKAACFRCLSHHAMLEFLGVRPCTDRRNLLDAVMPALSAPARAYWQTQSWLVSDGLLNGGRYERFVGAFSRLLRALQGAGRAAELFRERDRAGRERFYDTEWDNWRWRLLFRLFFNRTVMSRRGLSADYFHFDDGSASFAESFARRARRAIVELPVYDNYFLAQYVHGRYLGEDRLPEYLRAEHFDLIRERVGRIEMAVADVRHVFDARAAGSFDAICLSNVFELMSEAQMAAILPGIVRALRPGGTMTLRNLMIPRAVPPALAGQLVLDGARSRELHAQDRSFVYYSFQVYRRAA